MEQAMSSKSELDLTIRLQIFADRYALATPNDREMHQELENIIGYLNKWRTESVLAMLPKKKNVVEPYQANDMTTYAVRSGYNQAITEITNSLNEE
jgi:hypothetical protein